MEEYVVKHPEAVYIPVSEYPEEGHAVWNIECYAAFPCSTQNELTELDAKNLIANGFGPAKAANAGGVAVSNFEMSQNASMSKWSFEEVDAKLKETMYDICHNVAATAKEYGVEGNYVDGANISAFKKVADVMISEGI